MYSKQKCIRLPQKNYYKKFHIKLTHCRGFLFTDNRPPFCCLWWLSQCSLCWIAETQTASIPPHANGGAHIVCVSNSIPQSARFAVDRATEVRLRTTRCQLLVNTWAKRMYLLRYRRWIECGTIDVQHKTGTIYNRLVLFACVSRYFDIRKERLSWRDRVCEWVNECLSRSVVCECSVLRHQFHIREESIRAFDANAHNLRFETNQKKSKKNKNIISNRVQLFKVSKVIFKFIVVSEN